GGDELEFLRPANCQVIVREIGRVAKMGIPAFAGIDEKDAIAGVFDHAATVTEMKSEFGAFIRSGRENDKEIVGAAAKTVLKVHAFVLEKGELFAVLSRHAFDAERARQLKADCALAARFGAHSEIGLGVERSVGKNGCVDFVVERGEVALRDFLIG